MDNYKNQQTNKTLIFSNKDSEIQEEMVFDGGLFDSAVKTLMNSKIIREIQDSLDKILYFSKKKDTPQYLNQIINIKIENNDFISYLFLLLNSDDKNEYFKLIFPIYGNLLYESGVFPALNEISILFYIQEEFLVKTNIIFEDDLLKLIIIKFLGEINYYKKLNKTEVPKDTSLKPFIPFLVENLFSKNLDILFETSTTILNFLYTKKTIFSFRTSNIVPIINEILDKNPNFLKIYLKILRSLDHSSKPLILEDSICNSKWILMIKNILINSNDDIKILIFKLLKSMIFAAYHEEHETFYELIFENDIINIAIEEAFISHFQVKIYSISFISEFFSYNSSKYIDFIKSKKNLDFFVPFLELNDFKTSQRIFRAIQEIILIKDEPIFEIFENSVELFNFLNNYVLNPDNDTLYEHCCYILTEHDGDSTNYKKNY